MEDSEIVELFWSREQTAIEETKCKYSRYCFRISFNILDNSEDAEECVNDTYLNAWNAMPPHRPERLSTFLGKITRNLSLQRYIRNNAKKRSAGQTDAALEELEECIPAADDTEKAAEAAELTEHLDRFIRSLPQETRVIFVARYWFLYSIRDIACAENASEAKVKSALYRTRIKLREYLCKEGINI